MKITIEQFLKEIGKTEEDLKGYLDLLGTSITSLPDNLTVGGSLDLRGTSITSLPDNLTVGGSLDLRGTSITSLPDNLTVGGYLDLEGTSITSLPDNLTVGGSLDLRGTSITSLPDNLTVGGYLDLRGTSITSLPDNLTVGGSLDLRGTSITSLPDNLTVGGYLDLLGTSITSLPDNLTVGGSLDLRGTSITSLPDNLTVGGYLDLRGTSITSLPDNLTVGGSLYSDNKFDSEPKKLAPDYIFQWRNGKYIQVDDIMTEVIHTRGNTRKVRIVGKREDSYLVTDGNGKWAHGETLKKAKEDLQLKEPINKDTIITPQYYRIITGACELGVKSWMEQNNITKDKITAGELLPILKKTNAYGLSRFNELINF